MLGILGALLLAAVLFGAGVLTGRLSGSSQGASARAAELAQSNDELQNQLAILQRDRQVSRIADRVLQKNLAERDEEIRSLRADQAFYSKLVGADAQPGGLTVRHVVSVIQSIPGPIIGADIVELNPSRDINDLTAGVAAKFVKEIAARMIEVR